VAIVLYRSADGHSQYEPPIIATVKKGWARMTSMFTPDNTHVPAVAILALAGFPVVLPLLAPHPSEPNASAVAIEAIRNHEPITLPPAETT
jgi:hypothetical protein